MARDLGELNREDFARYKDDVKKEGKPFFPRAIFHDTVMSLIVVSVIVALAAIWYYTADGVESGLLGPWYTEPADPATTNFIPRPDWYFYFLFYLLRIFKWPETVFIATVGIPTICLILLLGLPFYDGRPDVEGRDGEGGARLGARAARPRVGAGTGLHRERGGREGRETVRAVGLPQLPHVSRAGRWQPWCA
jgi:hypothetical protein